MKTHRPANFLLRTLFMSLVPFVAFPLWGQESASATGGASIAAGTPWSGVTAVRLDVEFPGNGYHANWLLHRCDCGDLLIESELNLPGEVEKGELLLVGRRAVLERGFKSKELESEMSWDAPALMMQLAAYLLQRSIPEGPAGVYQRTVVSIQEEKTPIALDSGNAVGGFPAPWMVTTMVEPQQETHRRFDLQFSFSVPGSEDMQEMRLKGVGDYEKRAFPLPNDMPLNDWKLSWRNPDDPAQAEADVATLEELRSVISATESADTVPQ
jgi:hypothetical protein